MNLCVEPDAEPAEASEPKRNTTNYAGKITPHPAVTHCSMQDLEIIKCCKMFFLELDDI